jgi:hypothetical protein
MRDLAVFAEALAFVAVLPGFVTLTVLAPLRRPLLRLDREMQRLPPAHFRNVIMMPVTSVLTGSIAGIGVNLATGDTSLGWVAMLVIGFWRWLAGRNRWLVAFLATATGYSAAFLVWRVVVAIAHRRVGLGPGLAIIVVTPLLGPAQLWLWYRMHRATLREFGSELTADAERLEAAIAAAPPLTTGRRLGRAIRVFLDSRPRDPK